MQKVLLILDSFLWSLYRLLEAPVPAYFLGTFLLAGLCVVLGEALYALSLWTNRRLLRDLHQKWVNEYNLSLEAARRQEKAAYEAFNRQANRLYGRLFFLHTALSAAYLAPIPFALAWMERHFASLRFPLPFQLPLLGNSVDYLFTFLLMYVAARGLFQRISARFPFLCWTKTAMGGFPFPPTKSFIPLPESWKEDSKIQESSP